ncbi:hypothetical protein GCM10022223_10210 [Kineosporia mesophila]|uniref:PRC-barrel domain-containing protein n=1 Tax=Kineosporia mesophila TaxID=566012 RepID=A0ABP6Z3V1_9ACTN|nr:hypothetical protein [Kineosporia mesophila]MCD5353941.1 hypothetical protein [Kineosporia mesophila]
MTLTGEEVRTYVGLTVFDATEMMVGKADGIWFDDATGVPAWMSFSTSFFVERDAFVPAARITPFARGLLVPLVRDDIRNMPRIKPRDHALSGVQVARLHEFFGTFAGEHLTSAHEGAPQFPQPSTVPDPHTLFKGRAHETAFGTGTPGPNEPHDVTLQGTGNHAP